MHFHVSLYQDSNLVPFCIPCSDQGCYTLNLKFEVATIKDTRPGGFSLLCFDRKHWFDQFLWIGSFFGRNLVSALLALLYYPLPLHQSALQCWLPLNLEEISWAICKLAEKHYSVSQIGVQESQKCGIRIMQTLLGGRGTEWTWPKGSRQATCTWKANLASEKLRYWGQTFSLLHVHTNPGLTRLGTPTMNPWYDLDGIALRRIMSM